MSADANLQVIHDVYAAFGRGDVPGVLAALADDVTWSTPGPPDVIPYAGTKRGAAEVGDYFQSFGTAVETTAFDPQHFLADDDRVVVLGHYTFRVIATEAVVDNDWVHAFTLAGGKITAFQGFEDSAKVLAAFQARPA